MPDLRRAALRDAQDEALAGALPWLAWGLALFYAGLSIYWLLALDGAYPVLAAAWAVSAPLCAVVGLMPRRQPLAAATVLAGIVALDSLLLLAATRDPGLSVALFLSVAGFALVLPSARILAALVAVSWLGLLAVAATAPSPEWTVRIITFAGVTIVAFVAQRMRWLAIERLTRLHAQSLEQARTEATLAAARRESEFRGTIIRLAAHELATPLTPLVLQTHVLQQDPTLTGRHRVAVERMARNARRLERIVNDIVAIARQGFGTQELRRGPTDLRDLVAAEVGLASAAAAAAGVAVGTKDPGAPVLAHIDGEQVSSAIRRLLDNAVKFTPPGGHVELAARAGHEAGVDWVEVHVADTGPGVPPDKAHRIFEPFERATDPKAADPGGAGLGLAVVQQVAQAHGGQARVEQRPGGGSIFVMRLPAHA